VPTWWTFLPSPQPPHPAVLPPPPRCAPICLRERERQVRAIAPLRPNTSSSHGNGDVLPPPRPPLVPIFPTFPPTGTRAP
jgi:hypothetical protein